MDVVYALGLNQDAVHDIGFFEASRARRAADFEGKTEPADAHARLEDEIDAREARVHYVCDHGFRGLGLTALFDQYSAVQLGAHLQSWLQSQKSSAWPLAYAAAPLPGPTEEWRENSAMWEAIATDLGQEPATSPRELAHCLLPGPIQQPSSSQYGIWWNNELPGRRWSRRALAVYGIDLELLRSIVVGYAGDPELAPVSEISMPAMVTTLFQSIEVALTEARADVFHWERGLSIIQPTDPEVLLAARACLRSEGARDALRRVPVDLPMSGAVLRLVSEIDGMSL